MTHHRVLWATIVAVAAVNLALALSVWWVLRPAPLAPPIAARADAPVVTATSTAVERLAELVANAAFRSVITHDYAGLNDLVKRASSWPEIVYLSVHDAQGKVLAQARPASAEPPASGAGAPSGDVARETPAAREASAPRELFQEVTAPIAAPDADPAAAVGQVRLGYRLEARHATAALAPALPPAAAPPRPIIPFTAVLIVAALLAVPVGAGLVRLAELDAGPDDGLGVDPKRIRNLHQARRILAHWMRETEAARGQAAGRVAEAQRLRQEVASARTEHLTEVAAAGEQLASERLQWSEERARLSAELQQERAELDETRAALRADGPAAQGARAEQTLLETELADLREEVREARAALAGRPTLSHELLEQELRQHQHRVIAYISRTIRSALTNVLGFSKLLLRPDQGPLDDEQRASVESIHRAGSYLFRVAKDLGDLAQVEARASGPFDEIVDVAALLREAVSVSSAAFDDDVDVTVDCPPVLPAVRGNARRLGQVVHTLLRPPTTDPPGAVEVSARADEQWVTVGVRHRDAVIPAQDLLALFDPFSPIDSTSAVQDDGRRLRYALARAVLATIGGDLAVDAQPGAGTIFTVTLPVHAPMQIDVEPAAA